MNDTQRVALNFFNLELNRAASNLRAFPKYLVREIHIDIVKYVAETLEFKKSLEEFTKPIETILCRCDDKPAGVIYD